MKDKLTGLGLIFFSVLFIFANNAIPVTIVETTGESMEPEIQDGDELISISTTALLSDGDRIFYKQNGTSVVHDTVTHVSAGDDWTNDVPSHKLPTTDCDELHSCPSPRDGWITYGINNEYVDQSQTGIPDKPVTDDEIIGRIIGHLSKAKD